ncbi:hypothetical protein Tco_1135610, partial [Tanacetum coccineum]
DADVQFSVECACSSTDQVAHFYDSGLVPLALCNIKERDYDTQYTHQNHQKHNLHGKDNKDKKKQKRSKTDKERKRQDKSEDGKSNLKAGLARYKRESQSPRMKVKESMLTSLQSSRFHLDD